jgi:7-alpha-hydroxysteroid dehydrogenase
MLEVASVLGEFVTAESFAEAAVRLASCDPDSTNGMVFYSEDLLHPELGARGWLATTM